MGHILSLGGRGKDGHMVHWLYLPIFWLAGFGVGAVVGKKLLIRHLEQYMQKKERR